MRKRWIKDWQSHLNEMTGSHFSYAYIKEVLNRVNSIIGRNPSKYDNLDGILWRDDNEYLELRIIGVPSKNDMLIGISLLPFPKGENKISVNAVFIYHQEALSTSGHPIEGVISNPYRLLTGDVDHDALSIINLAERAEKMLNDKDEVTNLLALQIPRGGSFDYFLGYDPDEIDVFREMFIKLGDINLLLGDPEDQICFCLDLPKNDPIFREMSLAKQIDEIITENIQEIIDNKEHWKEKIFNNREIALKVLERLKGEDLNEMIKLTIIHFNGDIEKISDFFNGDLSWFPGTLDEFKDKCYPVMRTYRATQIRKKMF